MIGLSKSGHVSHLSRPFVWRPSSSSARSSLARPRPGARRRRRTSLARTLPPADARPFFPTPASAAAPHLHLSRTLLPPGSPSTVPAARRRRPLLQPHGAEAEPARSASPLPPACCSSPCGGGHHAPATPPAEPRPPATADRWVAAAPGSTTLGAVFPAACNFNAMEALSKISLSPSASLAAQRKVSARVAHTAAPATAPVPAPSLQGCSGRS